MEEKQNALIQVIEKDKGRIEIIIDKEQYRPLMTSPVPGHVRCL